MSLVELVGVSKNFQRGKEPAVRVLESVSLQIQGPATVAIIGPNGTGKSTALRILAGLLKADQGEVRIDGKAPSETCVGFVPQSNPTFPWRRVIDDIAIGMEAKGIPREERHAQVTNLLKQFSIHLPLHRRANALSGGQRQVVNLCRALVGPERPKALLLDEPFSSLDPTVRAEVLAYLHKIRREMDLVTFLVSHQLDLAVLAADFIMPFCRSPICLTERDLIPVKLAHPRSTKSLLDPEFLAVLGQIEAMFMPGESPERIQERTDVSLRTVNPSASLAR